MMHKIFSNLKGFSICTFTANGDGEDDCINDGDRITYSMWLEPGDDFGFGETTTDCNYGNGSLISNFYGCGDSGLGNGDGDMYDNCLLFLKNENDM